MTQSNRPIQALLWMIALYHLALGALLVLSGELSLRAAEAFWGWKITGSPDLGLISQILGCYGIAFGLMMAVAALDPARYRHLMTVGLVLIALRLIQRALYATKVMEVFEVSSGRYWAGFALVAVIGSALTWAWLEVGRRSPQPAS